MDDRPDFALPFAEPIIEDDDLGAVVATLRSRWVAAGQEAEAFEREFAAFVDGGEGLAVTSASAALHLALLLLDLHPGDEVVTTPFTFAATASAILHAGGTPVFADVQPDGTLDPRAAAGAVGPRTRALLPVHYAGLPCDLDAFQALAERHGLALIQDAAHAIETRWRGRGLGAYGIAAYSFYATKALTTIDGGMLVAPDAGMLARAGILARQGIVRTAWARKHAGNVGGYEVLEDGWKYAMNDVAAALGRSQLRKVAGRHRRKAAIAARYDELLAAAPVAVPPRPPAHAVHAHHLYPVIAEDRAMRDALQAHLARAGIGTGIHFRPLHTFPAFSERIRRPRGAYPVAEDLGRRTLSLPIGANMTDEDVERVASAVASFA